MKNEKYVDCYTKWIMAFVHSLQDQEGVRLKGDEGSHGGTDVSDDDGKDCQTLLLRHPTFELICLLSFCFVFVSCYI